MAIQLQKMNEIPVLILRFSGIVEHKEHQPIIPLLERELVEGGPQNVLLDMRDLVSWQPSAVWEELRFDAELLENFQRIAVVSDRNHHRWAAFFARHLAPAEIRYFHNSDIATAMEWLTTGGQANGLGLDSSSLEREGEKSVVVDPPTQQVGEDLVHLRVDDLSLVCRLLLTPESTKKSRVRLRKPKTSQRKFHSSRLIPFLEI